jgi:hypothetical protein
MGSAPHFAPPDHIVAAFPAFLANVRLLSGIFNFAHISRENPRFFEFARGFL